MMDETQAARTRIKICGITSAESAMVAVAAGADAVGLVFAEDSPRRLDVDHALAIAAALPPFVEPVGVFQNRSVDFIHRWPYPMRQVHGDEDESFLYDLRAYRLEDVEAIEHGGSLAGAIDAADGGPEVGSGSGSAAGSGAGAGAPGHYPAVLDQTIIRGFAFSEDAVRRWEACDHVDALLIDGASGGGGRGFDHHALAAMMPSLNKPIILAGGLTPENVGEAIRTLRPYAVDVSTGVESSPGVKDERLIWAFCDAVRAADRALARGSGR